MSETIDRDALLAKYLEEWDKRLRDDGTDQYVEVVGAFAHYLDDPWVEPVERAPLFNEVSVALSTRMHPRSWSTAGA